MNNAEMTDFAPGYKSRNKEQKINKLTNQN